MAVKMKDASELQKKRGMFCCRLYPECSRDDFQSPQAENMHFLRSHSGKRWSTTGNLPHSRVKATAQEVAKGNKTREVMSHIITILQQHPEGLSRADLLSKLKENGVKDQTSSLATMIAFIARKYPESGIVRPERGFYKLGQESDKLGQESNKPRRPRRRKNANVTPVENIPANEEIVLLRDANRRKGDALMKLIELVVMLAE